MFFSKYSKFYVDPRNAEKIEKVFFDGEVIAFEFIALTSRFYWVRILVIRCQYVNKQSQHLKYY